MLVCESCYATEGNYGQAKAKYYQDNLDVCSRHFRNSDLGLE